MTDSNNEKRDAMHASKELTCVVCGAHFIFRNHQQELFAQRGRPFPKRCPSCRKEEWVRQEKANERMANEAWQRQRAKDHKAFEALLKSWPVIPMDEIHPQSDRVLYIIGNGFDLMHGVKSSYYAFRDSLGKRSELRELLETYLTPDDIWADFENALACFDISAMANQCLIDDWLEGMNAYAEEARAADFYTAVDMATTPIQIVAEELPRRFRRWVRTLCIGTDDRPLRELLQNGKVLCFNYTEFVETLYGIPEQNVCYIHGCRRKTKHRPDDRLILGHAPGASDDAFEFEDEPLRTRDPYHRAMIEIAQEQAVQEIAGYDETLTKNCREIITAKASFFVELKEIETIVVIGHSFSPVDWDYYAEIVANISAPQNAHWYFGCHSLRDLNHLGQMLKKLNIERSNVSVFRTDVIRVTPMLEPPKPARELPKAKTLCLSPDHKWAAQTMASRLFIVDQEQQVTVYEVQLSTEIENAFFFHAGNALALITQGVKPSVFLFRTEDGHWSFINELENHSDRSLLNPQLQHAFLTDDALTLVYGNRVRKFSLLDGALIANQALRNAARYAYEGEDISPLFRRPKKDP